MEEGRREAEEEEEDEGRRWSVCGYERAQGGVELMDPLNYRKRRGQLAFLSATLLSLPLIVILVVAPICGLGHLSSSVLAADPEYMSRLDRPTATLGLMLMVAGVSTVGLKFAAPALSAEAWPEHPVIAGLWLVFWIAAIVASSIFVVEALPYLLPKSINLIPATITWAVLETIGSLMPAVLTYPDAWPSRSPPSPEVQSDAGTKIPIVPTVRPDIARHAKPDLLTLLVDLASRDPGVYERDIQVAMDGKIITQQGTLARIAGVTKSTISRRLHRLSDAGHITLEVLARETRITVSSLGGVTL